MGWVSSEVQRLFNGVYWLNTGSFPGCIQTMSVIGPVFGYLLGSLCAKVYVDFEYVDMGE